MSKWTLRLLCRCVMTNLPEDVMTVIIKKLTNHPVSLWALYDTSVATRKATKPVLEDAYENRLSNLLAAMRMRVPHQSKPWRKLMAEMTDTRDSSQLVIKCSRCGRFAAGVLLCECHTHKAPPFPWGRALIGPIIATATIIAVTVISRRV